MLMAQSCEKTSAPATPVQQKCLHTATCEWIGEAVNRPGGVD